MPIFEFECQKCGYIQELIITKIISNEGVNTGYANDSSQASLSICNKCGHLSKRIMSTPHFRVTGANAKNGYSSIPTYEEVIDENGYAKKRWGK